MYKTIKSATFRAIRLLWLVIVFISAATSFVICFLWWHGGHVYQDHVEVIAGKCYVRMISSSKGVDLLLVRRWNWPMASEIRAYSADAPSQVETFEFLSVGDRSLASQPGLFDVRSGRSQTYLIHETPDGPVDTFDDGNNPVRIGHGEEDVRDSLLQAGLNWSIALPVVTARAVPHWLILSIAVLPLLGQAMWRVFSILSFDRSPFRRRRQL